MKIEVYPALETKFQYYPMQIMQTNILALASYWYHRGFARFQHIKLAQGISNTA